jgi:hypothetical protein
MADHRSSLLCHFDEPSVVSDDLWHYGTNISNWVIYKGIGRHLSPNNSITLKKLVKTGNQMYNLLYCCTVIYWCIQYLCIWFLGNGMNSYILAYVCM